MVAALLKTKMAYSPYGNSLRGGNVEYQDGGWVLRVSYKAGAPAPWSPAVVAPLIWRLSIRPSLATSAAAEFKR
jgi:hypothetical protein